MGVSPLRYARISSPVNGGLAVGALSFWRPHTLGESYRKEFPGEPYKHWALPIDAASRYRCKYEWEVLGPDGKPARFARQSSIPFCYIRVKIDRAGLWVVKLKVTDPLDGTSASYVVNAQVPTPSNQVGAFNWRMYPHCPKEFNVWPWPWDVGCKRPGAPHVLPWL